MAGVKGRSGGKREGAGAKPKATDLSVATRDPLVFLLDVMEGRIDPSPSQLKAAVAAARFLHAPKAEVGKKEGRDAEARDVVAGRFAPGRAPQLATVNGESVKRA